MANRKEELLSRLRNTLAIARSDSRAASGSSSTPGAPIGHSELRIIAERITAAAASSLQTGSLPQSIPPGAGQSSSLHGAVESSHLPGLNPASRIVPSVSDRVSSVNRTTLETISQLSGSGDGRPIVHSSLADSGGDSVKDLLSSWAHLRDARLLRKVHDMTAGREPSVWQSSNNSLVLQSRSDTEINKGYRPQMSSSLDFEIRAANSSKDYGVRSDTPVMPIVDRGIRDAQSVVPTSQALDDSINTLLRSGILDRNQLSSAIDQYRLNASRDLDYPRTDTSVQRLLSSDIASILQSVRSGSVESRSSTIESSPTFSIDSRLSFPMESRPTFSVDSRSTFPTESRPTFPIESRSTIPIDGKSSFPPATSFPTATVTPYGTDADRYLTMLRDIRSGTVEGQPKLTLLRSADSDPMSYDSLSSANRSEGSLNAFYTSVIHPQMYDGLIESKHKRSCPNVGGYIPGPPHQLGVGVESSQHDMSSETCKNISQIKAEAASETMNKIMSMIGIDDDLSKLIQKRMGREQAAAEPPVRRKVVTSHPVSRALEDGGVAELAEAAAARAAEAAAVAAAAEAMCAKPTAAVDPVVILDDSLDALDTSCADGGTGVQAAALRNDSNITGSDPVSASTLAEKSESEDYIERMSQRLLAELEKLRGLKTMKQLDSCAVKPSLSSETAVAKRAKVDQGEEGFSDFEDSLFSDAVESKASSGSNSRSSKIKLSVREGSLVTPVALDPSVCGEGKPGVSCDLYSDIVPAVEREAMEDKATLKDEEMQKLKESVWLKSTEEFLERLRQGSLMPKPSTPVGSTTPVSVAEGKARASSRELASPCETETPSAGGRVGSSFGGKSVSSQSSTGSQHSPDLWSARAVGTLGQGSMGSQNSPEVRAARARVTGGNGQGSSRVGREPESKSDKTSKAVSGDKKTDECSSSSKGEPKNNSSSKEGSNKSLRNCQSNKTAKADSLSKCEKDNKSNSSSRVDQSKNKDSHSQSNKLSKDDQSKTTCEDDKSKTTFKDGQSKNSSKDNHSKKTSKEESSSKSKDSSSSKDGKLTGADKLKDGGKVTKASDSENKIGETLKTESVGEDKDSAVLPGMMDGGGVKQSKAFMIDLLLEHKNELLSTMTGLENGIQKLKRARELLEQRGSEGRSSGVVKAELEENERMRVELEDNLWAVGVAYEETSQRLRAYMGPVGGISIVASPITGALPPPSITAPSTLPNSNTLLPLGGASHKSGGVASEDTVHTPTRRTDVKPAAQSDERESRKRGGSEMKVASLGKKIKRDSSSSTNSDDEESSKARGETRKISCQPFDRKTGRYAGSELNKKPASCSPRTTTTTTQVVGVKRRVVVASRWDKSSKVEVLHMTSNGTHLPVVPAMSGCSTAGTANEPKAAIAGTSDKPATAAAAVQPVEESKLREVIEVAVHMYTQAQQFYDGGSLWCRKCSDVFISVPALCRHLHSDQHQRAVDPDSDKAYTIPPTPISKSSTNKPLAPARGNEFIMPLQSFFCSLCSDFLKDSQQMNSHLLSSQHNDNFKKFLEETPGYERQYLHDKMMCMIGLTALRADNSQSISAQSVSSQPCCTAASSSSAMVSNSSTTPAPCSTAIIAPSPTVFKPSAAAGLMPKQARTIKIKLSSASTAATPAPATFTSTSLTTTRSADAEVRVVRAGENRLQDDDDVRIVKVESRNSYSSRDSRTSHDRTSHDRTSRDRTLLDRTSHGHLSHEKIRRYNNIRVTDHRINPYRGRATMGRGTYASRFSVGRVMGRGIRSMTGSYRGRIALDSNSYRGRFAVDNNSYRGRFAPDRDFTYRGKFREHRAGRSRSSSSEHGRAHRSRRSQSASESTSPLSKRSRSTVGPTKPAESDSVQQIPPPPPPSKWEREET